MIVYDTIRKYNDIFDNPTLHPLISLVDLNKSKLILRNRFMLNFYAIIIKESKCGDLRYGLNYYDYDKGTVVFFAPGQVISNEPEGELYQPYGTALIFHPDIIKGTSLAKQIDDYSFFSYKANEALHLAKKERKTIDVCFSNIETEIKQNIDKHSKKLIVANLELLLKYCQRFYDRQFITRENANNTFIEQLEQLIINYLSGEKLHQIGIPTVAYFADEMKLSHNYFGDLVKKETGKTALEYIQLKHLELIKEKLYDKDRSIGDISQELGFKYPQHFTRYFKQKFGITPQEYRSLN